MRTDQWHKAEEHEVHQYVVPHVERLERAQEPMRDRWYQLACLYDPYLELDGGYDENETPGFGQVVENLIASNVDSVTSIAAATEVRPRFVTDGASWKERRKAKGLAYYAEGLSRTFDIHRQAAIAFKECAIKGTGFVKVWADEYDQLRIENVMVDDIVVDERECRQGRPRQLHHRVFADRDTLIDKFPDHEDEIERAQTSPGEGANGRYWAEAVELDPHQIVVVESWFLPRGHKPGRHTICIDGVTLLDEPYEKKHFPFARIVWSERRPGFYGIGGSERIAGHQLRLNKYNWQLDVIIDRHAMPTTFVHVSDIDLGIIERNSLGNLAAYKGQIPQTVFPPAFNPDMMLRRNDLKDSGYEEFGMSRLTATAKKPAGIESGAGLREYRDATTQRFALQEKAFEQLVLDIIWLALDVCKNLRKPPVIYSNLRRKRFSWGEVEMDFVRQQLQAANNLPTTPAGRRQLAIELSQAGLISTDESRRLLGPTDPLDLEAAMSPYTAAVDFADWQIEKMLDGEQMIPDTHSGLAITEWRVQQAYLNETMDEAPEEILEALRTWLSLAANLLAQQQQAQQMAAMPGPGISPGPAGPPPMAPPTPALAEQAMQLQPQ